jgi:hypothetical protein
VIGSQDDFIKFETPCSAVTYHTTLFAAATYILVQFSMDAQDTKGKKEIGFRNRKL